MRRAAVIVIFLLAVSLLSIRSHKSAGTTSAGLDRSPVDLAVTSDARFAVTANSTSNTVSLVDLTTNQVISETPSGRSPFAVSISSDNSFCAVTNKESNSLSVYSISPTGLKQIFEKPAGDEPRGVAFSKDGAKLYVCLSGEDKIAEFDAREGRQLRTLDVGTEPWHLSITSDGARIAVGNARSQEVSVVDIKGWKVGHEVKMRGKNLRHIVCSKDGEWAYILHDAERGRPTTKDNIDLGWVIGSRLSRAPLKADGPREAIALDIRGKAVGDVDGLDISPDGSTIALSAGGTHEVVLLKTPLPFVSFGGPGDHVESEVKDTPGKYRRVITGGRPLGLRFLHGGSQIVVANYFENALQIINTNSGQITQTIPLGSAPTISVARKGEIIFHDAVRSFNQWYSCNSCHTEGHTNGSTFDTFNDGSYGTLKKTLSLRGVTKTGPWTWHGWQKDLRSLIHDSMTKSMQGPEPTPDDIEAVYAYLSTLDFRPNPTTSVASPSVMRGKTLFEKRGCESCHAPPNYTTPNIYKTGLESPMDAYVGFNPPSLRGVYNRSPYLHTGEAISLEQVLTEYHNPRKINGATDFSKSELADIVAFLNTL